MKIPSLERGGEGFRRSSKGIGVGLDLIGTLLRIEGSPRGLYSDGGMMALEIQDSGT